MFKTPIEYLKELIQDLIKDFANMAFNWIEIFMLKPTDFSKYPKIDFVYDFVHAIASSLCIVFVAWGLMVIIFNQMAGVQGRSVSEVVSKAALSFVLSASAPWLLESLVKLNNKMVKYFLDKGLDTKALEKFITMPNTAPISLLLMGLVIVALFVLLGMQYIQRIGEYIVLLVTAPIAAQSITTENFEVFSIWWRESISVIFSQTFQVMLLWLVLNMLTGTEKLQDYLYAIALMVIILKGPKYIRQFLYSSGAGRSVVGAAGKSSKMAIYKFATAKIAGR
ncbi:conjugal transfer protein TrbL family protein [Priestia megaterium]|uniref:conjugal transfer protein TrbL family protein n=1 Tax=Priestia megaterium TaxID=1404 RepID=UPI000BFB55DF|nr:conjugal transfer protein TrbL family protein [Priestia megaterium]PGQ88332.1 hypothetical protein COA18_05225 [Priestia megaterium]